LAVISVINVLGQLMGAVRDRDTKGIKTGRMWVVMEERETWVLDLYLCDFVTGFLIVSWLRKVWSRR
jgi:hypothetical protein